VGVGKFVSSEAKLDEHMYFLLLIYSSSRPMACAKRPPRFASPSFEMFEMFEMFEIHPRAELHNLTFRARPRMSRRFDEVTIEDEYEPPIGSARSPLSAIASDAVYVGGVPRDSPSSSSSPAPWRANERARDDVEANTYAYHFDRTKSSAIATQASPESEESAGYQYTFLERREGAFKANAYVNASQSARNIERKSGDDRTRIDADAQRARAAQRELWPDVAAYARQRTRESPPKDARRGTSNDLTSKAAVRGRESNARSDANASVSTRSAGSSGRDGAGNGGGRKSSFEAPKEGRRSEDDTASRGSWSFPFTNGGNRDRPSPSSPPGKSPMTSPNEKTRTTPSRAPWTPSPARTPLGSRIPPNSPASARTVRSLEAQMRRAAAWAAGEEELIKKGAHTQGLSKIFSKNQGLPNKAFRLAVAFGHIKAFMKALESARIEQAHGGGAKLAVVALCVNSGINALKNIIAAASMQLGEKFVRKMTVPLALTARASPLLLPATLSSMTKTKASGLRGRMQNVAAVVVPPLSLISFIGAMWPIRGGQLVGDAREHYGTITHDVFLDVLPWVNVFLKHVKPLTNVLSVAASMELASSGEEYAENGAFALILASILSFTSENRMNTNHVDLNVREIRAGTNVLFLLALSHAECAWRETVAWQRHVQTRQGGLEGATVLGRAHGRLGSLGGFTRAVARRPILKRDDSNRRPTTVVDPDAPFVDRVVQRLPVIGPVLIILGGFVF